MKLKTEPKKPYRKKNIIYLDDYPYPRACDLKRSIPITEFLRLIPEISAQLYKEIEDDCVDGGEVFDPNEYPADTATLHIGKDLVLELHFTESDDSYEKKLAPYYKKKAEYDLWFQENKLEIQKEMEKQEQARRSKLKSKALSKLTAEEKKALGLSA